MNKLKSRKFWMAIVSGLLVVFNKGLGIDLPEEGILGISGIALGYLASQGWVDGQEVKAKSAEVAETVKADAVKAGAEFLSKTDLKQAGHTLLRSLFSLLLLAMLSLCCLGVAQAGHPCKPKSSHHQMLEADRAWDNAGIRAQYLGDRDGYKDAQAAYITARKRAQAGK